MAVYTYSRKKNRVYISDMRVCVGVYVCMSIETVHFIKRRKNISPNTLKINTSFAHVLTLFCHSCSISVTILRHMLMKNVVYHAYPI